MFRSGYVAIIGRPNVGKSTLLNALLGQKIAAVTPKPQTTRHRILGIKNLPGAQVLFLDTPGIHKPHKSLNEYMMEVAAATLNDADLFLFLVEASGYLHSKDKDVFAMLSAKRKPVILLITKVDQADSKQLLPFIEECRRDLKPDAIIPIAAALGKGIPEIEAEILARLAEGPAFYPEDQLTDLSERFIAAEIIREKIMELMREEIPYSIAVLIEAFEEPKEGAAKKITRIRAAIIAEKDSQKGILVGKGGMMIKKIGELSRKDLEVELGNQVYLELFVRIEKDWTKDPRKVKEFAYET